MIWAIRLSLLLTILGIAAGAALRAASLVRYRSPAADESQAIPLRQFLGLPADHRLRRLVVARRDASAAAAWVDSDGNHVAIVPRDGGLRFSRELRLPESDDAAIDLLEAVDARDWPQLPSSHERLEVWVWDAQVPVYVTAGADGAPGIAGVDDDRDGVIDDLGELGASGSDDRVVAPGDAGYEEAAAGEIIARVIDRGALVPVADSLVLDADAGETVQRQSEVWLRLSGSSAEPPARISVSLINCR